MKKGITMKKLIVSIVFVSGFAVAMEPETPRKMQKTMEYELISAVEQGSPAMVANIIHKYGINPNTVSRYIGRTPLMRAADKGNIDVIRILIENGADVNTQTQTGYTALMMAAGSGKVQAVDFLLKAKANPNIQNNSGATALMRAIDGEGDSAQIKTIVKLLLKAGADINLHDKEGKTALDYAKENFNEEIVKLLQRAAR